MDRSLLARAVGQYRRIDQLSGQIELAMRRNDAQVLTALCAEMEQLQEAVQTEDRALVEFLNQRRELASSPELLELLALMERIQERNSRLLPQARSILALQRHELQKLQQGNTVLQGYRPPSGHIGSRISSSG